MYDSMSRYSSKPGLYRLDKKEKKNYNTNRVSDLTIDRFDLGRENCKPSL